MIRTRRELKVWEYDDGRAIVDYNKTDFREFWQDSTMRITDRLEHRIVQRLLPPSGGWIADVGCGFGRLLPDYRDRHRGACLIDYAANHLEMAARTYGHDDILYVAADACDLPLCDGVLSSAVSVRLTHHIQDLQKLLAELARVCRPGAKVLVSYVNSRNLLRVLRRGADAFRRVHEQSEPQVYSTHPALFEAIARRASFQVIAVAGSGLVYQLTRNSRSIKEIVERSRFLQAVLYLAGMAADAILGPLKLAQVQFVLLEHEGACAEPKSTLQDVHDPLSILRCPECHGEHLTALGSQIGCPKCGRSYAFQNKICDLRRTTRAQPAAEEHNE
jgi:ubiquinone/menaquinone biosynthesis C-methylase UbiE